MDMAMPALGLLPSLRLINWLFGFISEGGGEGKASTIAFPLRAPLILIKWRLHAHNSRGVVRGERTHRKWFAPTPTTRLLYVGRGFHNATPLERWVRSVSFF